MKISKQKSVIVFMFVAIVLCCFYLFRTPQKPQNTQQYNNAEQKTNKITIKQGTVGNIGNMRVGVISISQSEHINKIEPSATIQFYSPNDQQNNKKLEVYIGDKFTIKPYEFTVDSINLNTNTSAMPGSSSGYITLQFVLIKE